MRTMKEETYNAIKSRKLIGYNAPNHDLIIEGYETGYTPIESLKTVTLSNVDAKSSVDFIIRNDGKILLVFAIGNSIYYKVSDSEDAFVNSTNIAATVGTLIHTVNGRLSTDNFRMIKLKNGKILLMISDSGVYGSVQATIKVFVSNSGSGEDFQYLSTPYTYTRKASNPLCPTSVGFPLELDNGKILFLSTIFKDIYSQDRTNLGIFSSMDGGSSWEMYTSVLSNDYTTEACKHGVALTQSHLMYTFKGGDVRVGILESLDGGITWTRYDVPLFETGYSSGYYSGFDFVIHGDDIYITMVVGSLDVGNIYKTKTTNVSGISSFNTSNLWEIVATNVYLTYTGTFNFFITTRGSIYIIRYPNYSSMQCFFRTKIENKFKANTITVNKSKGGANTATLQVDNINGVANPRNPDSELFGILNLNRRVTIKQGYGDDIVTSFTGIIDSIKMSTMPQVANMGLRDYLKLALDQMVTKDGLNTITYTKQPIETIVADLCSCAGISVGVIEATGISIEKTFAYQSYADAFQFLSDLASFEFLADEDGLFHFRRDYQPNNMFVAWSFNQGVDIVNLSYELNDQDIYNKVKVYGRDGENIIVYEAPFLDAAEFNILPQKVLKVDATEASTVDELKKIAQRAIATMRSRTRVIEFSTIGIPHLQIGDFIQLFEESTMSADVYRLTGITLNWSDQGFTMDCKAFYYGDSVVPIELPAETATQTPNPTLNLIPEMTSNTAPSGVCRASSVYVLYQNDYKPWNAFNSSSGDLFWDASVNHGWIEYEFPENTIVDKYMVKARQLIEYNDAMPKAWTFEAFDGEKWVVLDTRTNQIAWQIYETREYLFSNSVAYPKYRLNISSNNGYTRLQLEQLAMYYGGGS